MATNLFIGGISYQSTDDDLANHFGSVGTVVSAKIITDRDSGKSKGFGFVEMSSDEEAKAAIDKLNGSELNGRSISVNEARPREERPRRDFGGGRDHSQRSY